MKLQDVTDKAIKRQFERVFPAITSPLMQLNYLS
jgi:hypothetical protein